MRIRTQCRRCGLPFRAAIEPGATSLPCPGCSEGRRVAAEGWKDDGPAGRVERCPLCGCDHLYRQKDVHRGWGCALIVVGAVLAPWTWGLSLLLLAALDLWLFRRLGDAVVCYRCDTVYRDARPTARQGEFNLLKHDVVKYGKTWTSGE